MPDEKLSPSQVILYQTEDGRTRIETRFTGETTWLSLNQITELCKSLQVLQNLQQLPPTVKPTR